MAGTFDETDHSKSQAAAILQKEVLQVYEKEAEEALQHLAKEKVHEMSTRVEKREIASKIPQYSTETLLRRWKQILDLIRQAMKIDDIPYYHGLQPRDSWTIPCTIALTSRSPQIVSTKSHQMEGT